MHDNDDDRKTMKLEIARLKKERDAALGASAEKDAAAIRAIHYSYLLPLGSSAVQYWLVLAKSSKAGPVHGFRKTGFPNYFYRGVAFLGMQGQTKKI
jgi:hypothetical protein